MSAINELIDKIENEDLRDRIRQEVLRMQKQKKFGLVFEEHIPEATMLYDVPIKRGSLVAAKSGKMQTMYRVLKVDGNDLICERLDATHEKETLPKNDMVSIARFGEPIYPYLKPIDTVCNAPDSDLWHTLIEADNYHALQLLVYLYGGKVDCIYIDPPYNSGARDWKYNNDYVDNGDQYRHSKWLSMMKKRLLLAKKLLNPKDSVLIITIDEKEYLHLGCLLEDLFPEAKIQMITTVINPKGNRRDNEFSRCEEYIFTIQFGESSVVSIGEDMLRNKAEDDDEDKSIRLRALLRGASNHGKRTDRPNLFYPLLFEKETGKFVGHGDVIPLGVDKSVYVAPEGTIAMWPIGANGTELTWNLQPSTLMEKHKNHFLSFSKFDGQKRVGYYFSEGQEENFKNGMYEVVGFDEDGAYIIKRKDDVQKDVRPMTVWNKKTHSASEYGTSLLNGLFHDRRFSFPKSVYAVHDTISFFVSNKPNALIVDFFAGSGTTLHAVNLLNVEDGGHRRCIMVTNNEVSEAEAKDLSSKGFKPGDAEWEQYGIAHYVNWPRTVCSIKGHDINGEPLKGNYQSSDTPMAEGFKANAAFFKLGFLDKTEVALDRQFRELLPLLWMKAGAVGQCPQLTQGEIHNMLVLPENRMAVLVDELYYSDFQKEMDATKDIDTVFIITDSESGFKDKASRLHVKRTYQLYRDYLENFTINYATK